jgi:hypothetical protein
VVIWYISPRFGMLYQEKSGNPGATMKNGSPLFEDEIIYFFPFWTFSET